MAAFNGQRSERRRRAGDGTAVTLVERAVRLGATNRVCPDVPGCPTLGDFIVNLDGTTVQTAAGAVKLSTAKVVGRAKTGAASPTR